MALVATPGPRSSALALVPPPAQASEPHSLAAVDLGSNSFHLVVAQVRDGHLHVVDRLRETVRLAAGLDEERRLDEGAMERSLACLERFGERLRDLPGPAVRAVGTNTLRSARNGEAFRRRAEAALGHRIEVIAGREEARLIYLGVATGVAGDGRRRLVVDIGGGSTEAIIGEGFETLHRESLYMGCVSSSRAYFPDGRVDKPRMKRAELAARIELEPIEAAFRTVGWEAAVGTSGTFKAVAAIGRAAGWCGDDLTRTAVRRLRRALIAAGSVDALDLRELKDDRRPVLAGGLAVVSAVFDALGLERMTVSEMALREGLLIDLLGRIRHEDVRDVTVARLAERYGVDPAQARRVESDAVALLAQAAQPWDLGAEEDARSLAWAARLHELGLAVSHNQYHKHGAYLLAHSDLAGFSRQEQALLSALVRGHRRKFPALVFEALDPALVQRARRLCVVLRLAVMLHRARVDTDLSDLRMLVAEDRIELRFPPGCLDAHPLTRADLALEAQWLEAVGFGLHWI